jgi:hypothetical protein
MCGNISVERSPIFSRLMPRSVKQNGRAQMSMTARDRAYRRWNLSAQCVQREDHAPRRAARSPCRIV